MKIGRLMLITTDTGLKEIVNLFAEDIEEESYLMDKFIKVARMSISSRGIVWFDLQNTNLEYSEISKDIRKISKRYGDNHFACLIEYSPDVQNKTILGTLEIPVAVIQEFYQPGLSQLMTEDVALELIKYVLLANPNIKFTEEALEEGFLFVESNSEEE